jgi:hypothetical protein
MATSTFTRPGTTSTAARVDVEVLDPGSEAPPPERAREIAGAIPRQVLFSASEAGISGGARVPDRTWRLRSAWPYQRETAEGTADVYYGVGHTGLVSPMIFADGFNYGPSDMRGLWNHFNDPYSSDGKRLLDQLLHAGIDVVLLGFDVRHTYVQANAGVAVSCIRRAIAERQGGAPLIVGGVSMGGLVTRYALAAMEHDGEDHQTATYLSYDSPHNGACIPLVLQQLAYVSELLFPGEPGEPTQADLIKSPAAQQLLWGWMAGLDKSGPVATASPLRGDFLDDLRKVGWFPARPRKLGVANGTSDGTGGDVPPDTQVFDWELPGFAAITVRTQPAYGERQFVGRAFARSVWSSRTYTTQVPPFDGAPGGTLGSYGLFADTLGIPIEDRYRATCFVPSVSAVALTYDALAWPIDLYTDIAGLSSDKSALDAFKCDTENTTHSQVTPALADWVVANLTR